MEEKLKNEIDKLEEMQLRLRQLKSYIKDQLANNPDYQKIISELEKLNAEKKKIVKSVEAQNEKEMTEIENLSIEVKKSRQVISDMVLVAMTKGEKIDATDKSGMILAPVLSVKFKKTGDYKKPSNK